MTDDPVPIAALSALVPVTSTQDQVDGVDLVLVRHGQAVGVFEGRCPHRGALLADGCVQGENLVCGLHGWDYRLESGVSAYDPTQQLDKFASRIDGDTVSVARAEVAAYRARRPEPAPPTGQTDPTYERLFGDACQDTPEEPFVSEIHQLGRHGLAGPHGAVAAMGVPRSELPRWDDLQLCTAQLHRFPLLDDEPVDTSVTIGPAAARPLELAIPVFVSDMSFGALSAEAKIALARGADGAGTATCSGEGGPLPEEARACSRYLYELATGRFGWDEDLLDRVQALHLKLGQGAKAGTGGHLPATKVVDRIAQVRGLPAGAPAVSPARFPDWTTLHDAAALVSDLRRRSGGIPIGVQLAAQHIERDLDAAVSIGVDYVILDGRGGTGAAPTILRDHIGIPTMPARARARRHLDRLGADGVTLIATGGLRRAPDMVKALALGADAVAVAVSNAALQAIGCVGMRACHTDNCPVGIATQEPHLRTRLPADRAAAPLTPHLGAITELMLVLARACGHHALSEFSPDDLTSDHREVAELTGVAWAGVR